MAGGAQLTIVQGPEAGKIFSLLPGGSARIGRSHSNDMALNDPSVSRFHCRIFFKPTGELWVSDLGSSNETLVNEERIQERQVGTGDRLSVGDTTLRVELTPGAPAGVPVDLGLGAAAPQPKKEGGRRGRIILLCAAAVIAGAAALAVWISKMKPSGTKPPPAPAKTDAGPLAIRFEKVTGSASNIFRFFLEVDGGKASLAVDDIQNGRHFEKPLTEVRQDVLAALAVSLRDSGFFELQPEYAGQRAGGYAACDLSVSVGPRTHRTRVRNADAPAAFDDAARVVEEFAVNEFGARALSRPREELVSLANESLRLGRQLRDERNLRYENLFLAAKAFKEAEVYLETIDPKPDFYADVVADRRKCEDELALAYNDLRFQADKAVKLKDWAEASRVLQIVLATIPDKSHEWHKQAEQQLLDVQKRVEK